MDKPRLLDLFSGAGGAAMGYHRAGFEVVGVDIKPQPNYPFEFHRANAAELLAHPDGTMWAHCLERTTVWWQLGSFAAIHASPPCQFASQSTLGQRNVGKEYPDLLTPIRKWLKGTRLPWVIENVPNAPMRPDYVLCGSQFGLQLVRHRWFEVSWGPLQSVTLLPPCSHSRKAITVTGKGTPSYVRNSRKRYGIVKNRDYSEWCKEAMGIDWMSRHELSQAIPPAYTEHLARILMAVLEGRTA